MAKKKKKVVKPTGPAALKLTTGNRGEPAFATDAVVCVSVALHNIREQAQDLAIERSCGERPVPKSAMVIALAELGLNWAADANN